MPSDVEDFVRKVETALSLAADDLQAAGLKVESVSLQLQTQLTGEGSASFKLHVVEFGGKVSRDTVQTIQIEFQPKPRSQDELGLLSLDKDLAKAIAAIRDAVMSAQKTLDFTSAEVTLRLQKTKEGEIKVLFGASGKQGYVQEAVIKITRA